MENNKIQMTLEEMEKKYKALGKMIVQKKQEELDKKNAEKESRQKEVDAAFDNYVTLLKKYIKDYGSYRTITPASADVAFKNMWDTFF